ncbi:MAG: preprotein translocase subunit SecY, partial [Candidatus Phytoplasma stylosanthis]|nr:preprotein translocase subunit SecY [Candidatus Phytoplasma stylosanthis]
MKKIISFLLDKKNIIKKIIFTLIIVFIYVIGREIPIPFLEKEYYQRINFFKNVKDDDSFNLFSSFFNMNSLNIFVLGISPYITASIIVQFAQKVLPSLKEWFNQGEKGKYKINLVTRGLTFFFALGQGWMILKQQTISFENNKSSIFISLYFLIVGTFICIWLSDLITSKGIGNGVSILIVVGISDKLFSTFKFLLNLDVKAISMSLIMTKILILFLFLILLILTVFLTLGYLKIPINYAINKNNDRLDKYIPIKLNIAGILPIILAEVFLNITQYIKMFENKKINNFISFFEKPRYDLGISFFLYLLLIILFSFFTSFITINPYDISEHLSKQNAYLKNIKPGFPTVKKITHEMFKIIFIGTIFLTLLSAAPDIINFFLILFK